MALYAAKPRKDALRNEGLPGLVRLCGTSLLYLPVEYAPGCLALPTCFRATAHYLAQYGQPERDLQKESNY